MNAMTTEATRPERKPRANPVHELETSVEAAAVLLSLAMRDTQAPVSELGAALARLNSHLRSSTDAAAKAALRDAGVCIQSLQFHDRLIQQLAAVRNFLSSLAHHEAVDVSGFGALRWDELLQVIRERLTSDSQHQLFDLLIRSGTLEGETANDNAPTEGSVELF